MDDYLNSAISHYKSLFNLPSYRTLVTILFVLTSVSEGVAFSFIKYQSILTGVAFGITAFFFPCIMSDFVTQRAFMRGDSLFTLRRHAGLSLFSCIVWGLSSIIGAAATNLSTTAFDLFSKSLLLSFAFVTAFRFLIINSTSSLGTGRKVATILLQPLFCFVVVIAYFPILGAKDFFLILFDTITLLGASIVFSRIIDSYGKRTIGIGAIDLFKAFVNSWAEGIPTGLEYQFEKLGEEIDVEIDLLAFEDCENPFAIMVVPALHPGPFRNVGSSTIPYDIQEKLSNKTGAVVCVPHGTAGHELDLTSAGQREKVIQAVVESIPIKGSFKGITRMVRVEKDYFKASCQVLGRSALVTLTCSPRSTEDLPTSLGKALTKFSLDSGLDGAVIIDSHNCIEQEASFLSMADTLVLQECAKEAIRRVVNEKRSHFECGVSHIVPEEFSMNDGMGPGGIVVLVLKTKSDHTAYVTIDGNNMIKGVREKILESIINLGINDCKIFTTDTHVVNAIGPSKRGYHPIGEKIEQKKLLDLIRKATQEALSNLRVAKVAFKKIKVKKVKVLGEKNILEITRLVDVIMKKIKTLAVTIFLPAIILAVALTAFF